MDLQCPVCGSKLLARARVKEYDLWRCQGCGLERIYPQPDEAALAAIYQRSYFESWSSPGHWESVKRMKQAGFRRYLEATAQDKSNSGGGRRAGGSRRLVDCGAATGFLVELAASQGFDAYAIELSEFGASQCRGVLGDDRVYEGQVEHADFRANPENRFDVITMIDFIEHVRDPIATLNWARAHLDRAGCLVLVAPCIDSFSHRLMGLRWPHYRVEHLWYFSKVAMSKLLKRTGFTAVRIGSVPKTLTLEYIFNTFSISPHSVFTPICTLLRRAIPARVTTFNLPMYSGDMIVHARPDREGPE